MWDLIGYSSVQLINTCRKEASWLTCYCDAKCMQYCTGFVTNSASETLPAEVSDPLQLSATNNVVSVLELSVLRNKNVIDIHHQCSFFCVLIYWW